MERLVELTDANFEQEVIKSDVPVLVDFWAVWCGPCRMVAPIVEEIAGEYKDKLKVGKVDVDSNRKIATEHSIRSIPTLMLFKGGEVVEMMVGALPKAQIVNKIAKHFA